MILQLRDIGKVWSIARTRECVVALESVSLDLGASRFQVFVKVILPGAPPNVFTGLRLGAGMALLWESFQRLETKDVFASVVTFGLRGVGTTWLLQWIERIACPWARR